MPSNAHYTLSGNGVEISYFADTSAIEIVLDESFEEFAGTHQLGDVETTEGISDGSSFHVCGVFFSGAASQDDIGRATMAFVVQAERAANESDTQTEAAATGEVLFVIAPGSPNAIRSTTPLAGTVSVPANNAGAS